MVENKEVYARQHPPAIHQFINSDFHNYQIGTYKAGRRLSSQTQLVARNAHTHQLI